MESISLAKASAWAGVCLRFNRANCAAAFALSSCCKERSRSRSEPSTPWRRSARDSVKSSSKDRALALADFQRQGVKRSGGVLHLQPHQHIDVGLIELLSGGKVGSAKLLAGDICTQSFDHPDSLFNGLASLGEIAALLIDSRDPQHGSSFSVAVTYQLEDRQSFVVLLQRLLRLSQRLIDPADAVECDSLPAAGDHCPP